MRIGHGYDVHRLVPDRKLILGGVDIPYEKGLLGYSDADVLVHALMDALLGAAAIGDIGKLFPDNDERYLGADTSAEPEETPPADVIIDPGTSPDEPSPSPEPGGEPSEPAPDPDPTPEPEPSASVIIVGG